MHYFSTLFGKELYMFRKDLLSIITSFIIVLTATGICNTCYNDSLLARSEWSFILTSLVDSQHNQYDKYQLVWIQYYDSWWWTVNLSETCRVLYQNKVEKVGFHYKHLSCCTIFWMSNVAVIPYRIFDTTYWSHFQRSKKKFWFFIFGLVSSWPLKMVLSVCPQKSVQNSHYTLRNFS
jgi:hypothetical protein